MSSSVSPLCFFPPSTLDGLDPVLFAPKPLVLRRLDSSEECSTHVCFRPQRARAHLRPWAHARVRFEQPDYVRHGEHGTAVERAAIPRRSSSGGLPPSASQSPYGKLSEIPMASRVVSRALDVNYLCGHRLACAWAQNKEHIMLNYHTGRLKLQTSEPRRKQWLDARCTARTTQDRWPGGGVRPLT